MSTEDIFRSLIMHGGVSDCLPCSSFGKGKFISVSECDAGLYISFKMNVMLTSIL